MNANIQIFAFPDYYDSSTICFLKDHKGTLTSLSYFSAVWRFVVLF